MPDYQGTGMNLEVIGASFGRTGTMSMKAALEELGFGPCYHMKELFRNPEHMGQWRAAMRGIRSTGSGSSATTGPPWTGRGARSTASCWR
jgi:hypothetical protein